MRHALVAKYGLRSGRFKDHTLFLAIQKATASRGAGWESAEAVELQGALNDAVSAIYPVTLVDLKRWDPYGSPDRYQDAKSSRSSLAFVLAAITLTLLSGYYTIWHKNATAMLNNPPDSKIVEQRAIIGELLYPLLGKSATLESLNDPNSPISGSYREKIDRIKALDAAITSNRQNYTTLSTTLIPTTIIYYRILGWIHQPSDGYVLPPPAALTPGDAKASAAMPTAESQPVRSAAGVSTAVAPMATVTLQGATSVSAYDPSYGFGFDTCSLFDKDAKPKPAIFVLHDNSPLKPLHTSRASETEMLEQFRCIIGLRYSGLPTTLQTDSLRQSADILGQWILPAFYGALGALMYFMRSILNPLLPNPNFGKVLLRITLSTFAAIAIAWFWSPTQAQGLILTEVTFGMLAIAFLVGFSIDIFFGLMDRLVTVAATAISRIGAAS